MIKIVLVYGDERFDYELSKKDFDLMLEQDPNINYEFAD